MTTQWQQDLHSFLRVCVCMYMLYVYYNRQMKGCGEEPSQGLRHKLLDIYAQQDNLTSEWHMACADK